MNKESFSKYPFPNIRFICNKDLCKNVFSLLKISFQDTIFVFLQNFLQNSR